MRATATVGGLLLFAWASTAMATDCVRWRKLDTDAKRSDVSGMIEGHLNSNTSKRYTSEHRVAFQRCLRGFLGQIVEELDEACSKRPGANAEYVDDVFDRYLLSCVQ